jgi:adenylate kinase
VNIILLGPQGSGKGTQAEKLAQEFGLLHFEAGGLMRELAKTHPDIEEIVNKRGALMPDDQIFAFVKEYLEKANRFDGLIFDGYPRSKYQYELIEQFLASKGKRIDMVIAIEIPEQDTIKRLSARRMDPVTGHIYNLITNPPAEGTDISKLIHREDDTPEAIKTRLAAYRSYTEPMIAMFKEKGILHEIDGTQSIDAIYNQIKPLISTT